MPENKNILIVDDSRVIHELLGDILRGEGYANLKFADSAETALKILGIESADKQYLDVDIILLDIMMPGMDGIEALRRIKAVDFFKDVPVVMVTQRSELSVLQEAFAAGALDYIVKPANDVELLARVRNFLRLKDEMDRRRARERELVKVTRELTKANGVLRRLSYIDSLTGIGNRRYFDELFRKEWGRARREACDLSIIMADIDFFKDYNDLYGHQAGDECLRKIALAMVDVLKRPVDFIARYGGEEFVVVLPHTDREGMGWVAESLRLAVRAIEIPHSGPRTSGRVSISLGGATMVPPRGAESDLLLAEADTALYRAKGLGRDCVELADSLRDDSL